jgi:L-arabinonolactonase
MLNLPTTPAFIIPSQCVLAEGPVWDDRAGCLWFTDIQQSQLLCWQHAARRLERIALPDRLGSLALTDDPDRLLLALADGFALFSLSSGRIDWLHRLDLKASGMRLNDGRVDRQGRFWTGAMVEDEARAPATLGALYRLDPPGRAPPQALRDGIRISNSICFSPDGAQAYFADSTTGRILRYPADGPLGEPTLFARTGQGSAPDGSDVDALGRLWNAEWGGTRVTAYNPDGTVAGRLALPVSQVTCVAFGGPGLDLLFVTSASEGLPPGAEPHAGDVLVYEGPFQGLPAGRFRLG